VISTIFGANLTLFDGIRQQYSCLTDFDPKARLVNLRYQEKKYLLSANGAVLAD
jgi:hypothetical protein